METVKFRRRIREFYDENRKPILESWNRQLKKHKPFQDAARFLLIKNEQEEKTDLFSILSQFHTHSDPRFMKVLTPIVNRIHTSFYSVTDFTIETYCLEDAVLGCLAERFESSLQWFELAAASRRDIFDISRIVLSRSVGVYEYVVENGNRAFSYFEKDGKIIYVNKAMLSLTKMETSKREMRIMDFFVPHDSALIKKMLKDHLGCITIFAPLTFKNCQGDMFPVGAEICPVILDGKPVGGYASLVNLEIVMKSQQQVYDKSPLGIIKVNRKNEFSYANPAAQEMLGETILAGRSIRELFKKRAAWQTVRKQLDNRFSHGVAGEYETEIATMGSRPRTIPVRISGIPETDLKGNVIGSMALIHNLEMEKACDLIHEKIETFNSITSLYQDVARIVNGLVPFREMIISRFSSDLNHIRSITWRPDEGFCDQAWGGVWWAVPRYLKSWLTDQRSTYISDLEAFFSHPSRSDLLLNPAVQAFLKKQLLSMVRIHIYRGKKLIATISFFRKARDGFSQKEIEIIKKLPLRKTVLTARYETEKARMRFRLDLMNEIHAVCGDLEKVGQVIVSKLVDHYQWHNAAFFAVDRSNNVFRLKGQCSLSRGNSNENLLSSEFTQKLEQGVLGYVCRYKRPVNISNIRTDKKFKKYFVNTYGGTVSELCFPILVQGKVCWILNVEDERENAFSKDQVDSLKLVINEVGEILKRVHAYHIHQVTLEATSDTVITTDAKGKICTINPAGERFLQVRSQNLVGKSLRRFFQDKSLFDRLKSDNRVVISGEETIIHGLRSKNNQVLLSSSPLPQELGGRVFIAKDISLLERLRELEFLGQMTNEVALQTKTPLALMFSWLGRIHRADKTERKDLVEKLTKQLGKIEMTTDRMALMESGNKLVPYNRLKFKFQEIIKILERDFPVFEMTRLKIQDDNTPKFYGDLFQIKFCMETIISYLLRYLPEDKQINIRFTHTKNWVQCRIKGYLPSPKSNGLASREAPLRQTLKDMALGEPVIRRFIEANHRGKYMRLKQDPGQFVIKLPVGEE